MIVFLIGDSITQGYWDSGGGWADRVRSEVVKRDIENEFKYYHGVHNLGIDGNTTQQVLDRFDSETKARYWRGSEYGIVIAVGTNDTVINNKGETQSDPSRYRVQLEQLLTKAKQLTDNIAFVNLLPVDEAFTKPLPSSSTGKCYTNERIESFNRELERFCMLNKIKLIDVNSEYLQENYEELFSDGLHPNDDGHKIIFDSVMPVLENWLYPQN